MAGISRTEPAVTRVSTRAFTTPDGADPSLSSLARQHAPGSGWRRSIRHTRRRIAAGVVSACRNHARCAPTSAHIAASCSTGMSTRPGIANGADSGADSAFGESRRWPGRRTENPSVFRPCGVSGSPLLPSAWPAFLNADSAAGGVSDGVDTPVFQDDLNPVPNHPLHPGPEALGASQDVGSCQLHP